MTWLLEKWRHHYSRTGNVSTYTKMERKQNWFVKCRFRNPIVGQVLLCELDFEQVMFWSEWQIYRLQFPFDFLDSTDVDRVQSPNACRSLTVVEWSYKLHILIRSTTKKLINTNRNTKEIFLSVNFRGILPTEIFPRYIPTVLPWEKNLKQSKKKNDVSFFPTEFTDGIFHW